MNCFSKIEKLVPTGFSSTITAANTGRPTYKRELSAANGARVRLPPASRPNPMKMITGIAEAPRVVTMTGAMPVTRNPEHVDQSAASPSLSESM